MGLRTSQIHMQSLFNKKIMTKQICSLILLFLSLSRCSSIQITPKFVNSNSASVTQTVSTTEDVDDSHSKPLDGSYQERFKIGYMPFEDYSDVTPERAAKLAKIEMCNLAFADFLEEHKMKLTKSPPDVPAKVSVMFIVTNIYEINERAQTVTLSLLIEFSWRDMRLFKAVEDLDCGDEDMSFTVQQFSHLIWFPVWTIENSAERTLYNEAWDVFPAVVHNRSIVTWITTFRIVLNVSQLKAMPGV